uniref:UBX domain-containing protein 4 n=2 Tax=Ciona intestinalis TaxID=7719 RepID=F7BA51_CIOIN
MREQQQKIKMMKEIEERKKDKQMEIEARRKVREQLAQDRLERASRFQQEKEEKTREEENRKKQREVKMTQEEEEKMKEREKIARIQFRFPNGSSITRNYPRERTLGEAIEDLREQPVILPGNFRLAIGIPRRVFTSEEEGQSLGDLGLTPSASLSIQPVANKQVHARQDSSFFIQIYTFIVMFLSLPFKLLAYVWSAIFGGNQNATNTDNSLGSGRYDSVRPGSDTPGVRRRNVPGKSVTREGKMHRLSDMADKDDDDATWNGNSTQQM